MSKTCLFILRDEPNWWIGKRIDLLLSNACVCVGGGSVARVTEVRMPLNRREDEEEETGDHGNQKRAASWSKAAN